MLQYKVFYLLATYSIVLFNEYNELSLSNQKSYPIMQTTWLNDFKQKL